MDPSDEEIVGRIRAGDVDAFRFLLDRHYPGCLRFAVRQLGNRADAEEAVQDAFTRAFRFLPRYEERQRFASWLYRILINQCRSIGGRQRRVEETFIPFESIGEDLLSGGTEPELPRIELQRALARLSDEDREALLLKYLDDQTYEDMAEQLGVGVSALKMRVKRARERLLGLLGGAYDE
jgi:RNA polymerase sigma-70 factor, ECF subfamily